MEKLSVMIVDDEQWIARLVEALIRWDELEMSLQGTFYDGNGGISAYYFRKTGYCDFGY